MVYRKTINIFFLDGDPNGRLECDLSNWSGKVYKIPRININLCSDLEEVDFTGVYLLFGKNEDGKDLVYIGESESVLTRIKQHLIKKDFWNEAIILVALNNSLDKAEAKYLENQFYLLAKKTNRYAIDNPNIPTSASISKSKIAKMEEFLDYSKMFVNTLGHKVFEEKRELKQKQKIFTIKSVRGAEAQGEPTSEGFVVLKGSKAANTVVKSLSPSSQKFRMRLMDEGILVDKVEYFEFSDDSIFSSPSSAAVVVMGRNANGLTEWKLSDGTTLKEFEANDKT